MGQFSFECSECGDKEQFDWTSEVIVEFEVLRTRPRPPHSIIRDWQSMYPSCSACTFNTQNYRGTDGSLAPEHFEHLCTTCRPVYEAAAAPFTAAEITSMPEGALAALVGSRCLCDFVNEFDAAGATTDDELLHAALKAWQAAKEDEEEEEDKALPEYKKLKVGELKAKLEARGLETDGVKAALVSRLEKADTDTTKKGKAPAKEVAAVPGAESVALREQLCKHLAAIATAKATKRADMEKPAAKMPDGGCIPWTPGFNFHCVGSYDSYGRLTFLHFVA
jgi:hypothetical protein